MLSDPIGDMLTRIRNGYMAKKSSVAVTQSKVNKEILLILKQHNYIADFKKIKKVKTGKETKFFDYEVDLVYHNGEPAVGNIKRVSKPGRRIYTKSKHLRAVLSGYGIAIVSTPQGLMTNKQARSKKLGGELLCQIW